MKHNVLEGFVCCLAFAASVSAQTITSQPQSLMANEHSSALFSVSAASGSTYQWQFNGNAYPSATDSYLFLDNLTDSEAGTYTVVVTPPGGSPVTSAPATLTLIPGTIVTLTITNYPGGASSNVTVQLFDFDKPATVANFLHYVTSGAYSNMFFDRLVPGFVLQGGGYDTRDMTNTAPGISGFGIYNTYELSGDNSGVPFPDQVDSEFGNGVFIPNTFGTLAMALSGNDPDSATSAFFINLADNSSNLDTQAGGFTVFGRVIDETNALLFFNNIQANGGNIVDYQTFSPKTAITILPVNYTGSAEPSDANLFYCDFTVNNPPVYNTGILPGVAITFPANGAVVTNTDFVFAGTATTNQWTGIARVRADLFPQSGIYVDQPFGADAVGTTNWSLDFGELPAGVYIARAVAQDGYGIIGNQVVETFSVWSFLSVSTNGLGTISAAPGMYYAPGVTYFTNSTTNVYTLKATPAKGLVFAGWSEGTTTLLTPTLQFEMLGNKTLTANFIADNMPKGITFTYPHAGADLTNTNLTLEGKVPASLAVTNLTCQLFIQSSSVTAPQAVSITGANWSATFTNLTPGQYTARLAAYDSQGRNRLISENFNILAQLTLATSGQGQILQKWNGKYLLPGKKYAITAVPAKGSIFAYWSSGVANVNNASTTFILESNTTLTATFETNPFPAVAGAYAGLFLGPTNVAATNCGALVLNTTATGAFSGKLILPNSYYTLIYRFYYDGSIILGAALPDKNELYIYMNLDLTNALDTVTGGVMEYSSSAGVIWTNSLVAYRTVKTLSATTVPAAGKYDLLFDSLTNDAMVDGYAAVNFGPGGGVTLAGTLADNTPISSSTGVSKDGVWPVFATPAAYKGKGMLIGWETNTATNCTGQLFWVKDGTTQVLNSTGTNHVAPTAGNEYAITFSGGSLGTTLVTNFLGVTRSGGFTVLDAPANKLSISLAGSGVVIGQFNSGGGVRKFKGIFTASSQSGAGFITDSSGEVGAFSIDPAP